MNTVLKRKLSSVIANESIAKNIGKGKYVSLYNTTTINKNNKKKNNSDKADKAYKVDRFVDKEEHINKKQKKTHYNDKMEPIRLSSNSTCTGTISRIGARVGESGCFPKRIREVVWSTYNGETYSSKCYVKWCNNMINVFNYQVGHDIPESKGGTFDISNLRPICSNCNLSMGNKWTIQEWSKLVSLEHKCNDKPQTEQPYTEQQQTEQPQTEQPSKIDLPKPMITPETTSRITFITLLFLTLNLMII